MTQENVGQMENVEKTLEKTDIGHFINHHKNLVLIGFVVILIAVIGFSFYKHQKEKNSTHDLSSIYAFKNATLLPFVDGKIQYEEFNEKFKSLPNDLKGNPNLLVPLMSAVQKMENMGLSKEAFAIVDETIKFLNTSNYLYVFWSLKYAALAEDNGQVKSAIDSLEKILSNKTEIARAQVYLQLGRLYKIDGNTDKAKTNFKFILDKFPNDNAAKLAKFYMEQL